MAPLEEERGVCGVEMKSNFSSAGSRNEIAVRSADESGFLRHIQTERTLNPERINRIVWRFLMCSLCFQERNQV